MVDSRQGRTSATARIAAYVRGRLGYNPALCLYA